MIASGPQAPAHLNAIHPRHEDVEHDGVGCPLGQRCEGLFAIRCHLHLVAGECQGAPHGGAHCLLVIYHQNSHGDESAVPGT